MKKEDLKTGMLAQMRDGDVYLIINEAMFSSEKSDCYYLSEYNDSLKDKDNYSDFDIVKLSKVLSGHLLLPKYWTEETLNNNLLWERKDAPEYVELLEDSYGGEVKKGSILKVVNANYESNGAVDAYFNEIHPSLHFWKTEFKPSTKEAYEAQQKPTELTVKEIAERLNIRNLKIVE